MNPFEMEYEEEANNHSCGDCIHFSVKAYMPGQPNKCRRIDHKAVKFYHQYFHSYDCNQHNGIVCCEFVPDKTCVVARREWKGFDHWWKLYQQQWIGDATKRTESFFVNGDTDHAYKVKLNDYVFGTMYDDNCNLKAVQRWYYKRDRKSSVGHRIVHEDLKEPVLIKWNSEEDKKVAYKQDRVIKFPTKTEAATVMQKMESLKKSIEQFEEAYQTQKDALQDDMRNRRASQYLIVDDVEDGKQLSAKVFINKKRTYNHDDLKAKLPKDKLKEVSDVQMVAEFDGLKRFIKRHPELRDELKEFIVKEFSINNFALKEAIAQGTITEEELEGCYTEEIKQSFRLQRINIEQEEEIDE